MPFDPNRALSLLGQSEQPEQQQPQSRFNPDAAMSLLAGSGGEQQTPAAPASASVGGFDPNAAMGMLAQSEQPAAPLAPPQIQRTPADADSPAPWNAWDDAKLFIKSAAENTLNYIPGVNNRLVTDYEAVPAPNRGGGFGKAVDTGADLVSGFGGGALGARVAGPVGMGIVGGLDTLGRNEEEKRIEIMRRELAANPSMLKDEADAIAKTSPETGFSGLDAGDYAEAGLSGLLNFGGGKIGQKAFSKVANSGAGPTVKRLLQSAMGPVAYDAVTGAIQGGASMLNRENVDSVGGAIDTLTRPENVKQMLVDAAIGGALSLGGQAVEGVQTYRAGRDTPLTPAREAELQGRLDTEQELADIQAQGNADKAAYDQMVRENAAERQRIADVEARAAQARDLVERARAETNRVQAEQAARDSYRDILPELARENASLNDQAIPAVPFSRNQPDVKAKQLRLNRDQRRADLYAGQMEMSPAEYLALTGNVDPAIDALAQRIVIAGATSTSQAKKVLQGVPNETVRAAMERAKDIGRFVKPVRASDIDALGQRVGHNPSQLEAQPGIIQPDPMAAAKAHAQRIYDETLRAELERRGIAPQPEQPRLLLPEPEGYRASRTAGEYPGLMRQADTDSYIDPDWSPYSDGADTLGYVPPLDNAPATARVTGQKEPTPPAAPGEAVTVPAATAANAGTLPGPYGDATPNPIWGKVKRPANMRDTQGGDDLSNATPEQTGTRESIEGYGNSFRNEEGELPRRIRGANLRTMAGDDEAKKNFITGAMLLDEDADDLARQVTDGLFEKAAKVTMWDSPAGLAKARKDGGYSAAEGLALADKTAAAVRRGRESTSPENVQAVQEHLAAHGKVGSAQGLALGARNIPAEAWEANLSPGELALFNMQKMWNDKGDGVIPKDIIERLLKVDPTDRKALLNVLKYAAQKHAGVWGRMDSWRYASMLSSPLTHTLNAVSNATKAATFFPVHASARFIDAVAPGQSQLAKGETRAALAGMLSGINEAATNALFAFRNGYTMADLAALDPRMIKPETGVRLIDMPSRALHAADEFFKGIAESQALAMHAHRKAWSVGKDKGLKGKALDRFVQENATNYRNNRAVRKAAKDFATRAVWQEGAPISMVRPQNLPPSVIAAANGFQKIVVPFLRVIANVTKEGTIYSGAGFLAPLEGVAAKATGTKPRLSREAKAEAFAKATMGTAASIALVTYGMGDNITTDAPKDPRERELFYESGKRPYSIKIGNRWIDYRMLGPLAWPIMNAKNYADSVKENPNAGTMKHLQHAAQGVVSSIVELPVLSGVGGLIDVINDPTDSKVNAFLSNIASQFVPYGAAQRFVNTTGAWNDAVPETQTVMDRVRAGTLTDAAIETTNKFVPRMENVLPEPLPQRLNSFGQPVTRKGVFPSAEDADPVFKELDRLGILPMATPERMAVEKGGGVRKLTPEERRTILSAGQPAHAKLLEYISNPRYQGLPEDKKAYWLQKKMKDEITRGRDRGKRQVKRAAK